MGRIVEYNSFKTDVVDRINTGVFMDVINEWRRKYVDSNSSGSGINEKSVVGALLFKSFYRFSDEQLWQALSKYEFRSKVGLGYYYNRNVFVNAYVEFTRLVSSAYYSNHLDLISQCLSIVTPDGEIILKVDNQRIPIRCNSVLIDIVYQQIYELVFTGFKEVYQKERLSFEPGVKQKVEELLGRSHEVVHRINHTQLVHRLDTLGEMSFALLKRLGKVAGQYRLKNYFDWYFEVSCGQICLREFDFAGVGASQTSQSTIAYKTTNQPKSQPVSHADNQSSKSTQSKVTSHNNIGVSTGELDVILKELKGINSRISELEKRVEAMSTTIGRQNTSLVPFEKQASRLETLYKNIEGLESRIASQESSLRSMVEKHMQIATYSQELSQTSKDIYDMMKLFLIDSCLSKTE